MWKNEKVKAEKEGVSERTQRHTLTGSRLGGSHEFTDRGFSPCAGSASETGHWRRHTWRAPHCSKRFLLFCHNFDFRLAQSCPREELLKAPSILWVSQTAEGRCSGLSGDKSEDDWSRQMADRCHRVGGQNERWLTLPPPAPGRQPALLLLPSLQKQAAQPVLWEGDQGSRANWNWGQEGPGLRWAWKCYPRGDAFLVMERKNRHDGIKRITEEKNRPRYVSLLHLPKAAKNIEVTQHSPQQLGTFAFSAMGPMGAKFPRRLAPQARGSISHVSALQRALTPFHWGLSLKTSQLWCSWPAPQSNLWSCGTLLKQDKLLRGS